MKRNLFSWLLYDAGNSFVEIILGSLFLAQWIVLDNKFDDVWYSAVFVLATIAILVTAPFLGAWSDKTGRRLPFVQGASFIMFVATGLLALVANSPLPINQRVIFSLSIAVFVQYFYQLGLVFYNTLLEKLASKKNLGEISGLGQGLNNFGWIVAMGILLLFTNGTITLISGTGRAQAFIPAFFISVVLCLPLLVLFKEKRTIVKNGQASLSKTYREMITGIKELVHNDRNTAQFLVAFCLISDAVLTLGLYWAIFMDQVYKVSDNEKFHLLSIMIIGMILGGYILGRLGDRVGIKNMLLLSCIILIAGFTTAAFLSWAPILYLVSIVGGVGWGTFYVTTRALLIKISPPARLGEYFGFFSTFQRLASIIGPLMWSLTTLMLKDYGIIKYRVAILTLTFIMFIGTILLTGVKEQRTVKKLSSR